MSQLLTVVDSFKDDFEKFSNFYPVTILYDLMQFPTVEHAYVAAKTLDMNFRRTISKLPAKDAGLAKRMGRNKKLCKLRPNWDLQKVPTMAMFIDKKFDQLDFKEFLLSTGDVEIIEGNYWHDNFWGDCYCKKCQSIPGKNNLGKILMKKRGLLQWQLRTS